MRISPPVLNFDRMALADTVIGGKYPIKRGEAVTVTLTGALPVVVPTTLVAW